MGARLLPLAAAVLAGAVMTWAQAPATEPETASPSGQAPAFVYGGDRNFPPYEYLDEQGRPAGFTIELVQALATQAKVRVEIRLGVWRDMVGALEQGDIDFMTLAYSAGRADRFAWLERVWTLRQALAYEPGRGFYPTQLDELAGETVAVEERSFMHEMLEGLPEGERPVIVTTDNQLSAVRLVDRGEVSAAAGNALTLQTGARQTGRRLVIVDPIRALPYRFATRPGHEAVLAWLGPSLVSLRESGRFHRLVERHLLVEPAASSWWDYAAVALTATSVTLALMLGVIVWNRSLRRQVEARQSAVERTARLQTVTAALSEALTPADVARVVVDQSVASLGAVAGLLALRSPGQPGRLDVVYSLGFPPGTVDPWHEIAEGAAMPLTRAARTGTMVLVESLDELRRRFPALPIDPVRSQTRAMAAVPLPIGTETLGALGLSFGTPRPFSADDQGFMLALGRLCAQALERARLYQGERVARSEAEAASHAKDDFLATLSHELRTPINAIVGWTHMLRRGALPPDKAVRALETVERNARAQMQLIDDLLDVSRAVRGNLQLDLQPIDLGDCLEAALETVRPVAEARRITLVESIAKASDDFDGDPARIQQVFWNLLSNSLKFTPPGGRVEVTLHYTPEEAVVRLTDTGLGIEPGRLPHVFERFYQGDNSTTRAHGGLGLGLSIAKHIVELHGGDVAAASAGRHQGSTFTVRLPRRSVRHLRPVVAS